MRLGLGLSITQPRSAAPSPPPASGATTWDTGNTTGSPTFSNGDLTATCGATGSRVIATKGVGPGQKGFFELTDDVGSDSSLGVALGTYIAAGDLGYGQGIAIFDNLFIQNGAITYFMENHLAAPGGHCACWIDHAADGLSADVTFFVVEGGGATPYTASFTGCDGSPIFPVLNLGHAGDRMTLNAGASAFVYGVPSGFTALDDL